MRFCELLRHPRDRLSLGRRVIDHFRVARDLASVNLTHEFSLPVYRVLYVMTHDVCCMSLWRTSLLFYRVLYVMTCVICHFDAQIFSAFLSFVMSLGLCSLDFSLLFVFVVSWRHHYNVPEFCLSIPCYMSWRVVCHLVAFVFFFAFLSGVMSWRRRVDCG